MFPVFVSTCFGTVRRRATGRSSSSNQSRAECGMKIQGHAMPRPLRAAAADRRREAVWHGDIRDHRVGRDRIPARSSATGSRSSGTPVFSPSPHGCPGRLGVETSVVAGQAILWSFIRDRHGTAPRSAQWTSYGMGAPLQPRDSGPRRKRLQAQTRGHRQLGVDEPSVR